jgi:hypothetical protein
MHKFCQEKFSVIFLAMSPKLQNGLCKDQGLFFTKNVSLIPLSSAITLDWSRWVSRAASLNNPGNFLSFNSQRRSAVIALFGLLKEAATWLKKP